MNKLKYFSGKQIILVDIRYWFELLKNLLFSCFLSSRLFKKNWEEASETKSFIFANIIHQYYPVLNLFRLSSQKVGCVHLCILAIKK